MNRQDRNQADMKPFSVFDSPLGDRVLIEASAGTGKTFTVCGLFFRLILEEKADPEKILIVTFTKLATKELKDRIYNYLRQSIHALEENDVPESGLAADVVRQYGDQQDCLERLRYAYRQMDEVTISTIHGFCQKIIREESLAAGTPADFDVIQEDEFLVEAAEDFWREFIDRHSHTREGRFLLELIFDTVDSPESLVKMVAPIVQDGESDWITDKCDQAESIITEFLDIQDRMMKEWMESRSEIERLYTESDVKRASQHWESRAQKTDHFLDSGQPGNKAPDSLVYFTPERMASDLKKHGNRLPDHPFFDECGRLMELQHQLDGVRGHYLAQAARQILRIRGEKCLTSSTYTYDDLLGTVREALSSEIVGRQLASRIRSRFSYALVDEFQDTDPVQYEIFDRIYSNEQEPGNGLLFMIGDPKQSIYAFRGADLFTYLTARERVREERRFTLRRNFRSRPDFVRAVNRLFSPDHNQPFLDQKIQYHLAEPEREDLTRAYLVNGQPTVPLTITDAGEDSNKTAAQAIILDEMIRQVRDLLDLGDAGKAGIQFEGEGWRNLAGGDIAILVQSHAVGDDIRRRLKREGIKSVSWSRKSVFETGEAERLARLFTAILNPADMNAGSEALMTGFFASSLIELIDLVGDEERMAGYRLRLYELNDIWHRNGVQAMFRRLMIEDKGVLHLAEQEDGERIITNLEQLLDIAGRTEIERRMDPPGLLRWLLAEMKQDSSGEEEQLRLESDENLVRISTIHNSKGLQFPVVFCPSLCFGSSLKSPVFCSYHEEDFPYRKIVNMEQQETEGRAEAIVRSQFESIAEEVRKAYVAVTRAQFECRLFWSGSSYGHYSGLGALVMGPEKTIENLQEGKTYKSSPEELSREVKEGIPAVEGILEWRQLSVGEGTDQPGDDKEQSEPLLNSRPYRGKDRLAAANYRYNFSSLIQSVSSSSEELRPGEDDWMIPAGDNGNEPVVPDDSLSLFDFPRGKEAGIFLHALFEHSDLDFRNAADYSRIVKEVSSHYGVEERWEPVLTDLLKRVPVCDYGRLEMNRVAPDQMVAEMEFSFRVREPNGDQLFDIIRSGKGPPSATQSARGFMNGFIDLIVEQDGLYSIIDYKSNDLGRELSSYEPDNLHDRMTEAGYDLQYHIYTVALKRYLESVLPEFDYESHFGGVYYLFLRGLTEDQSTGIYVHKPEESVIRQLEEVLYEE